MYKRMRIKKYLFLLSWVLLLLTTYTMAETPQGELTDKIHALQKHEKVLFNVTDFKKAGINGIDSNNIHTVVEKIKKHAVVKSNIAWFNYSTKSDYRYDFNHTNALRCPVEIENNNFILLCSYVPKHATAFLEVQLESTELGEYFLPFVTAVDKYHHKTVQTFENGTVGKRYLNLSSLSLHPYERVQLVGKHISVPDQNATLYLFKPQTLDGKHILIVAPHPDDAEIAAFGLYSTHPENTYIVTVTAGEAGADEIYTKLVKDKSTAHLLKGKHRIMEGLAVPIFGNVSPEHCVQLGYFDTELEKMYRYMHASIPGRYNRENDTEIFRKYNRSPLAKHLYKGSDWQSLVDNFEYLVKTIQPDIIVTPYPLIDRHPDHQFSTVALIQALRHIHWKKGKFFFYTNHFINSDYYPFGKRGEAMTLPPMFAGKFYFDALFSYPLSSEKQADKLLALDMMSDIRYSAQESVKSDVNLKYTEMDITDPCKGNNALICRDYSYFRRGIRENELFYVVDVNKIYTSSIDLEKGYALRYVKSAVPDFSLNNLPICAKVWHYIDSFIYTDKMMKCSGWACIPGCCSCDTKKYILLQSKDKSKHYMYTPFICKRNDVAKAFKSNKYVQSGFDGMEDIDALPVGTYTVSLILQNKDGYICKVPLHRKVKHHSHIRKKSFLYYIQKKKNEI